jgi:serine/threonine protein kinase
MTKIIGSYRFLKVIGEGGFGRTYLAEHTLLKEKAVIKQALFKSKLTDEILLKEASLLWNINHWGLPTVKDVFIYDGDLFMVMNFIEGIELMTHIKDKGPLAEETVCWIMQRLLSSLYYLHYRGVIHRDVKPANVITNFNNHIATLVDFGLSKLHPDGTPDPSGYTPIFGAPEQIEGKSPRPESDIYGLGMTALYLLGGNIYNKTFSKKTSKELTNYLSPMLYIDIHQRPHNCEQLNIELNKIRKGLFGRTHSFL